jgi:uncharacterized membrane protein
MRELTKSEKEFNLLIKKLDSLHFKAKFCAGMFVYLVIINITLLEIENIVENILFVVIVAIGAYKIFMAIRQKIPNLFYITRDEDSKSHIKRIITINSNRVKQGLICIAFLIFMLVVNSL